MRFFPYCSIFFSAVLASALANRGVGGVIWLNARCPPAVRWKAAVASPAFHYGEQLQGAS